MVTLHQLQIFSTVASHLNISNAAADLHVTQAAISNRLKALQTMYKTRLYTKNNRGIELTEAGKNFLNHVNGILSGVRKLNDDLHVTFPQNDAQLLTVGGNFSASASILPQLIAVFKRAHPQVRITLKTSNRVNLERMVLKSKVEMAVINAPSRSPHLVSDPYRNEKLVVFASPKHPLARTRLLTVDDLTHTAIILRGIEDSRSQPYTPLIIRRIRSARSQTAGTLRQIEPRWKPNVVLQCGTPDAVKVAVKNKLGIGVLFEANVKSDIRNGDFKMLELRGVNLEGQSYITYSKDRPLSDNAQAFLSLMRQKLENSTRVKKRSAKQLPVHSV